MSGDHARSDGPNADAGAAAKSAGSAFPRTRRLLSPAQFSAVLSASVAVRTAAFALHVAARTVQATAPDTATAWRLGLVIPKRFVASAVRRNAIKRRWREAFRVRAAALDAQFAACDLVVRMTTRLPASKQVARKRRQVQQRSATEAVDAAGMIDRLVAQLSSKKRARHHVAGWPSP